MGRERGSAAIRPYGEFQRSSLLPEAWGTVLASPQAWRWARNCAEKAGRVFCLTSDGEWNEGSCWEALIFMAHQKLDNLTFIVDLNGMQGFGSTRQVANLDSLADKFRAFGVTTLEVDGHDVNSICAALASTHGPLAIVANTRKGCGVSFMENQMAWHYLPMSEEQYQQAVREVKECGKLSATV